MTDFEKLQERALLDATKIACTFEAYVRGLEEMADIMNERLAAAHEELEATQSKHD